MTDFLNPPRNSHMDFDKVYFWTDTVKDWIPIFYHKENIEVLLSSLGGLVQRGLISVYSFVIMPNHLHLVWEIKEMNGKETPVASFNKFTSHLISKKMKSNYPELFFRFQVNEVDRIIRIWQRDPLAVLMDSVKKVEQKIEYIHLNPLQGHWNLCKRPEDYPWSSAEFYEKGIDRFGFLTDYRDRF